MVLIPGGRFLMGSDDFYPEERPARRVQVAGFEMDRHLVTNASFACFVAATGHVTWAERPPSPGDYPGVDPALLVPGSLVFQPTTGPVPLHDPSRWWAYVPDACWHRPEGPGSGIDGRMDHPVVHVAHADALAFAAWVGKALPDEAEWEYAARGGLEGAAYAWGEEFAPNGRHLANTWQGEFPWQNLTTDGFAGTSPVGAYPPNGYGLSDMIGNVWEWTCDDFRPPAERPTKVSCCGAPKTAEARSLKVVKGGSHLCAPGYCRRYRPAARQPQEADTSTSHIGFRCVRRSGAPPAESGLGARGRRWPVKPVQGSIEQGAGPSCVPARPANDQDASSDRSLSQSMQGFYRTPCRVPSWCSHSVASSAAWRVASPTVSDAG